MNRLSGFVRANGDDFSQMLKNLGGVEKSFPAGSCIMRYSKEENEAAILTSGRAYLVLTNGDGQRSILEFYEKGSVFGRELSAFNGRNPYYVAAKTKCSVLFFPSKKLFMNSDAILTALLVYAANNAQLHSDILSRRSIREKLTAYFESFSSQNVTLDISYVELADFLSVNRSAMMRELRSMNDEKIIFSDGRNIKLLKI